MKERSGAFTRLSLVGASLLRLEKGEIPSPCERVGAGFGLSARGQNSDINTHAPEEKNEDNDYPSLFCFAPARAPFRLMNTSTTGQARPPAWQALARARV